jgi:hypothetical protein
MKNKWDIIGKDIDRDNSIEFDDWFYMWYDGWNSEWYPYDGYDVEYEYIETTKMGYINKHSDNISMSQLKIGSYIDMVSIYPKSVQREIKINQILGIEKWKPTFGDLINKKENEN